MTEVMIITKRLPRPASGGLAMTDGGVIPIYELRDTKKGYKNTKRQKGVLVPFLASLNAQTIDVVDVGRYVPLSRPTLAHLSINFLPSGAEPLACNRRARLASFACDHSLFG